MKLNFIFSALLASIVIFAKAQNIPEKPTDVAPLLIGEKAPKVALKNVSGASDSLLSLLGRKPTVLIFYRGGWCPYCNVHLAELQNIEKDILKLGYQIFAVSPDSPENLHGSIDKHKLNYLLLSDSDMKAALAFGIAYGVADGSKERLRNASGGSNPGLLPVPSLFVLNQNGEILFEYINPDYKKRIRGSLLLSVLKELQ